MSLFRAIATIFPLDGSAIPRTTILSRKAILKEQREKMKAGKPE